MASIPAAEAHLTPEEYWCPEQQPVEGGYTDAYGAISPLPEHDGTECLKWDDSLGSHAEHFRVSPGKQLALAWLAAASQCRGQDSPCLRAELPAKQDRLPDQQLVLSWAVFCAVSLERVQGTAQRDRDE